MHALIENRVRRNAWWCLCIAAAGVASNLAAGNREPLALAYLDPGAGSFIIQALVASIAGVAVATRVYWTRIKSFFSRTEAAEAPADAPGQDGDE